MRIGAVPVPVSPLDKADNFRHYVEDSYADASSSPTPALLAAAARGARRARRRATSSAARRQRRGRARRRAGGPERRARRRAHAPRRHGLLALQLGLDRQAEGRRAPPARHRGHVRDLRAPGARAARGRRRRSRPPSSSTPTGWATGSRSRCGSARPRCSWPARRRPEPILATLREHRPDGVLLGPGALRRCWCASPTPTARSTPCACASRPPRRCPPHDLRPLAGALRPGDRRRHRLDRDAAHLLLQPRRARVEPGTTGRAGAGLRAAHRRRGRRACSRAPAVGDLEVRGDSLRGLLLAPAREDQGAACAATGSPPATATSAREDGAYVYVGRIDDMLKVGGLWVSPIDMEHVLVEHPRGRRRPAWSA